MKDLEERTYLSNLLEVYGDLLTSTQKEILNESINMDLSISEIGEINSISRSAAEDAISKATTKLKEYEKTLHIVEKSENCSEIIAKLKQKDENYEQLLEELEKINAI
ncbi:MAG: DNA-binding protein [Coprobacillus sp.]|nr:DNA-binding protein [Coprobacillus sp.]